tara:strand:- start:770 stop:2212 length:1443 start_codon:yes stop_codon:yes gene_type:complete
MQHSNTIICIGSGNEQSATKAENIAKNYNKDFHFVYDGGELLPGVYHTSIYDYNLQNLLGLSNISFVYLDDSNDDYGNEFDFYKSGMFVSQASARGFYIEYPDEKFKNDFYNIIETNAAICVLPWLGLHKTSWGDNSCCVQQGYVPIDVVKKKMLAGEQHQTCSNCYDLEKQKAVSKRMTASAYWSQRLNIKNLDDLLTQASPKYFDLRLSNKCNAMCRSCNPDDSNLIDKEYHTLGFINKRVGTTSTKFITTEQIHSASRLYFAGGEPLIHEDFLLTLEELKNENKLDSDIIVNTNASVVPQRMLDAAKDFTNLTFVISTDGIEDQLTYIRWPIKWNKFVENIKVLNQLAKNRLHFNVVISIYNIARCYETFKWITDTYPTATIEFTVLVKPYLQQAKFFPNKPMALENLQKIKTLDLYDTDKVLKSKVDMLTQQMLDSTVDVDALRKFFEFNDALDNSRNAHLKDFIPELEECRKYVR